MPPCAKPHPTRHPIPFRIFLSCYLDLNVVSLRQMHLFVIPAAFFSSKKGTCFPFINGKEAGWRDLRNMTQRELKKLGNVKNYTVGLREPNDMTPLDKECFMGWATSSFPAPKLQESLGAVSFNLGGTMDLDGVLLSLSVDAATRQRPRMEVR